jgi:hypothetical protein
MAYIEGTTFLTDANAEFVAGLYARFLEVAVVAVGWVEHRETHRNRRSRWASLRSTHPTRLQGDGAESSECI